jgi:hypothetical protein
MIVLGDQGIGNGIETGNEGAGLGVGHAARVGQHFKLGRDANERIGFAHDVYGKALGLAVHNRGIRGPVVFGADGDNFAGAGLAQAENTQKTAQEEFHRGPRMVE